LSNLVSHTTTHPYVVCNLGLLSHDAACISLSTDADRVQVVQAAARQVKEYRNEHGTNSSFFTITPQGAVCKPPTASKKFMI